MDRKPLEGWTFVGNATPTDGQRVETLTVWGEHSRLLFGIAQYHYVGGHGGYWAETRMLDTPSYWRPATP